MPGARHWTGRRILRLSSVPLIVVAMTTRSATAAAFNYAEHAHITARGMRNAIAKDWAVALFLGKIQQLFGEQQRLCQGTAPVPYVAAVHPTTCFSLADLPALSGDHSPDPAYLVARWFESTTPEELAALAPRLESASSPVWASVTAPLAHSAPGDSPPDACGTPTSVDRDALLRITQAHAVDRDAQPPSDLDVALAGTDAEYLCAALHGSHHFRLNGVTIENQTYEPPRNAIATYAKYHVRAILYLLASRKTADDRLVGFAVLYEMFALHFLEDAVAAGHLSLNYSFMNPASAKETHDLYNREGLRVGLPLLLCDDLDETGDGESYPLIDKHCRAAGIRNDVRLRQAVVRGDGSISTHLTRHDPDDVTEELAARLVQRSLEELVHASSDMLVNEDTCLGAVIRCLKVPVNKTVNLSCAEPWRMRTCDHEALLDAVDTTRVLIATRMLPTEAEPTNPRYVFSGWHIALAFSGLWIVSDREKLGERLGFSGYVGVGYRFPPTRWGSPMFGLGGAFARVSDSYVLASGSLDLGWFPTNRFGLAATGDVGRSFRGSLENRRLWGTVGLSVLYDVINTDDAQGIARFQLACAWELGLPCQPLVAFGAGLGFR